MTELFQDKRTRELAIGWTLATASLGGILVTEVYNYIVDTAKTPGILPALPFPAGHAADNVSWRFTRFVIDDEELRIESGVLVKTSRKIAFERIQSVDIIQPFAARIFACLLSALPRTAFAIGHVVSSWWGYRESTRVGSVQVRLLSRPAAIDH